MPQTNPLTPRQISVLSAIIEYQRQHNKPPTYRELWELSEYRGIAGVQNAVKRLVTEGLVEKEPHQFRAILPTAKGKRFLREQ